MHTISTQIVPAAPLWINPESPPITEEVWEFFPLDAKIGIIWDKMRNKLGNYFLRTRYTIALSARVYGRTYEDAQVTVLGFTSYEFSPAELQKIQAICMPFTFLPVSSPLRHSAVLADPAATKHRAYEQTLFNGASIDIVGRRLSACSFGGYIRINGETLGMTCSHGVVPDGKMVTYQAIPRTDTPIVQSPAQLDHDERIRDLFDTIHDLQSRFVGRAPNDDQKAKLSVLQAEIAKRSAVADADMVVGAIRAAPGERTDENGVSLTCDWALIDVAPDRMGRNTFPGLHRYTVPPHPRRVGRLVQEFWGKDGRWVLQPICYRGRTSGFSTGFTRKLKTLLVDDWGTLAQKVLIHGYSFVITSSDHADPHRSRQGDSGAWVWECEFGNPVAQILWGVGGEVMGVSLEDAFDEMEDSIGLAVKVA